MHKHDNINTSLMLFCPFKVVDLHNQGHTDEPIGSSFLASLLMLSHLRNFVIF